MFSTPHVLEDFFRHSKIARSDLDHYNLSAHFMREGQEVYLSAGQQLFALLITSVVSVVRPGGLLLIDEPELYLHPNLEIAFVRMLKGLLERFRAYAILATHSAIITREVPAECVQVVRAVDGNVPVVDRPSFQTFGADVSAIINYVFDNPLINLPFQQWLIERFGNYSFDELLQRSDLNEESITFLRNFQAQKGRG